MSSTSQTAPDRPAVLKVNEVADRLRVNPQTVRRWLRSGELAGTPFGNRTGWRITEEELEAFIARRREERMAGD